MPAKRDPYVQIDVGLDASSTVRDLATRLESGMGTGVPRWLLRRAVVGLLAGVWGRMLSACPDGCVVGVTDEEIEEWAGWKGEEGAFASAFRSCCIDDGEYAIGWERYEALHEKREKDRVRQREKRGGCHADRRRDIRATETKNAGRADVARMSTRQQDDIGVTSRGLSASRHAPEEKRETAVLPPCFAEGGSTDSLDPEAVKDSATAPPSAGGAEAPPPSAPIELGDGRAAFATQLRLIRPTRLDAESDTAPSGNPEVAERLRQLLSSSPTKDGSVLRPREVLIGLLHAAGRVSEDRRSQLIASLRHVSDRYVLDALLAGADELLGEVGATANGDLAQVAAQIAVAVDQAAQIRRLTALQVRGELRRAWQVREEYPLRVRGHETPWPRIRFQTPGIEVSQ
jgi:hypothetical protein